MIAIYIHQRQDFAAARGHAPYWQWPCVCCDMADQLWRPERLRDLLMDITSV